MTRPLRLDRWPLIWASIVLLLCGVIAALTVSLVATHRAADTARCVNSILAERAPLTQADHWNERRKIEDQIDAEKHKEQGLTELATARTKAAGRAGFRLYQQGVAEFVKALDDWKTRDDRIAAEKATHPLGVCK